MKRSSHMIRITAIALISMTFASCASLYLKGGKDAYQNLQYQDAIYFLDKAVERKDDADGRRKLAESYLKVNNYEMAAEVYDKAASYTDNTDSDRLNHARALMGAQRYDDAKTILQGIVSRDPGNMQAASMLKGIDDIKNLKADSLQYIIEPVSIMAPGAVFASTPYQNGLIVSVAGGAGANDPYTNTSYTNLFFTKREGAAWSSPEALPGINGNFHDAVAAVAPSGLTMVFTRSYLVKGKLGGNDDHVSNTQLVMSVRGADGTWSEPTVLPFCQPNNMFAHPTFSADSKTLYFSSDMAGGQGGMDIWSSNMVGAGWSNPVNLGSSINTPGNEVFPVIKGADQLYFSSNGRESLGGLDLFYSNLRNGLWEKPVHVTYPINSATDDFSMTWNADGKSGFFSSDRYGSDRIFAFTFDDSKVTLMGLVLGKDSKLPLGGAKVIIRNLTDGTEQMFFTDGEGKFQVDLMKSKDYEMVTVLDGYEAKTEKINTRSGENPIMKVIELDETYITDPNANNGGKDGKDGKDGKNEKEIPDIHWDYNAYTIRADAYPFLDKIVTMYKANKNLKFELSSHTDCRGSMEYNDDLAAKRAKAITDYLNKKGVPKENIISKGYGERQILNRCKDGVACSEKEHEENRRTEFKVIGKK